MAAPPEEWVASGGCALCGCADERWETVNTGVEVVVVVIPDVVLVSMVVGLVAANGVSEEEVLGVGVLVEMLSLGSMLTGYEVAVSTFPGAS